MVRGPAPSRALPRGRTGRQRPEGHSGPQFNMANRPAEEGLADGRAAAERRTDHGLMRDRARLGIIRPMSCPPAEPKGRILFARGGNSGDPSRRDRPHSHSIVAGGFELMSYTTRFTPGTSFTIRLEIFPSTSYGSLAQSAVIPSSDVTARMATTFA